MCGLWYIFIYIFFQCEMCRMAQARKTNTCEKSHNSASQGGMNLYSLGLGNGTNQNSVDATDWRKPTMMSYITMTGTGIRGRAYEDKAQLTQTASASFCLKDYNTMCSCLFKSLCSGSYHLTVEEWIAASLFVNSCIHYVVP